MDPLSLGKGFSWQLTLFPHTPPRAGKVRLLRTPTNQGPLIASLDASSLSRALRGLSAQFLYLTYCPAQRVSLRQADSLRSAICVRDSFFGERLCGPGIYGSCPYFLSCGTPKQRFISRSEHPIRNKEQGGNCGVRRLLLPAGEEGIIKSHKRRSRHLSGGELVSIG